MKYAIGLAVVAVLAVTASGCADKYESAISEQLGYMKEMNSILAGVTDKDSLKAAKPKIEAISKRMDALTERMKAMGEAPEARKAALEAKYKDEATKEAFTLMGHMMRISQIEGGQDVGGLFKGFGKD